MQLFCIFQSKFVIVYAIKASRWKKYNLMEYITLCLERTNKVEQWYCRYK